MNAIRRFTGLTALVLILMAMMLVVAGGIQAAAGPDAFRFVVYADSRGTWDPGQEINVACLNYMNNQIINLNPKPDLVFFLGDMVTMAYDKNLQRLLPSWKELMQNAGFAFGGQGPGIPLYVAIGNHELYDSKGDFLAPLQGEYQYFFPEMPDDGPPGYSKLAFTVKFGNSLFIVLDTFGFKEGNINWDNGIDEVQYGWFYTKASSSQARHKFVLSHGPAFSAEGLPVGNPITRDLMWQAMQTFNFDSYLAGHEHIFARGKPDGSLTQIISGSAGAQPDPKSKINSFFNGKYPIKGASDYNFTVVDVKGDQVTYTAYAVRPQPSPTCTVKIDPLDINGPNLLLFEP
jgi:hypothetical protein